MDRPLTVLHLAGWYPNRVHPTNGNFVEKHIRAVAPHVDSVVLNVQGDTGLRPGKLESLTDRRKYGAVHYVYFGSFRQRWLRPVNLLLQLRAWYLGWKAIQAAGWRPDLLHVHVMLYAGLLAWWLNKRLGIPFLILEHSTIYTPADARPLGRVRSTIAKAVASAASCRLAVSRYLGDSLIHLGLWRDYRVVYNVVDADIFRPDDSLPALTPFRFLHISSWEEKQKNIRGILQAFTRSENRDLFLTLAGNGPRGRLEELLSDFPEIRGRVQVIGPLSESGVAELMRQHHAFILFSNYETLSCVLIEAQVAGMPAIATHTTALPEVLNSPELGYLVPPGDTAALGRALQQLRGEYARFNREEIRRRGLERFEQGRIGEQLLLLYRATAGRLARIER